LVGVSFLFRRFDCFSLGCKPAVSLICFFEKFAELETIFVLWQLLAFGQYFFDARNAFGKGSNICFHRKWRQISRRRLADLPKRSFTASILGIVCSSVILLDVFVDEKQSSG
jgi:hypothetical protein